MHRSTLRALALLVCAPVSAAQATISAESFDYPVGNLGGQNGGSGWSDAWDAGAAGAHGAVVSPGFDLVGNKARIDPNNGFAVCFRTPDTTGWDMVLDNGKFGVDGSTLWFTFDSQRVAGAACQFGGFSLFDGGAERLFLGSPWQTFVWGIDDHAGTGPHSIPGSNSATLTRIVVRIDYQAGMEHLRMWLDPPTPYPTTAADIDKLIGNHRWTRIRIASGTALPNGYDFDAIRIETETGSLGTSYCGPAVPNSTGNPAAITATGSLVVANNDVTLTASDLPANQFGYFLNSLTQGFVQNPGGSQGNLCLGGQIGRYNAQIFNTGATGTGSLVLDLANTPVPSGSVAIMAGETWNFTSWFRDNNPGPTSNFTDGVTMTFQ